MIYQFLKYLYKLTFETYFRVIRVSGHDHIPEGPVVFVANHPSTLMDPVVIATILRRPIFFLAAAEFMGKGLLTKFMQSFLNMIPVYRPDTLPGEAKKNADVFYKCFEHLGRDGAILIFPEGSSVTQRKIRPLKTGAVRIALGAEADSGKTVNIIPIGLNYSNPHQFRSECFVSIGKPLNSKMKELEGYSTESLPKKFTSLVQEGLRQNVIHLEDESVFELYEKIKKIVTHEQQTNQEEEHSQLEQFKLGQHIQDSLAYYIQNFPKEIHRLSKKLDQYIERLEFYQVTDKYISKGNPHLSWGDYLKVVFSLPLYGLGLIVNSVPFYLTQFFYGKMEVSKNFRGSILLNIGLVLFLIWYIMWGVIFANIGGAWWIGILAMLFMYIAGKFTLKYLSLMNAWKQQSTWQKLLKRDRNIFNSLQNDRKAIITDLIAYHQKFIDSKTS